MAQLVAYTAADVVDECLERCVLIMCVLALLGHGQHKRGWGVMLDVHTPTAVAAVPCMHAIQQSKMQPLPCMHVGHWVR